MFYMGEPGSLWAQLISEDHEVYELVFLTGADPDRIREWSMADRKWLMLYPQAKRLAAEELQRRAKGK